MRNDKNMYKKRQFVLVLLQAKEGGFGKRRE